MRRFLAGLVVGYVLGTVSFVVSLPGVLARLDPVDRDLLDEKVAAAMARRDLRRYER